MYPLVGFWLDFGVVLIQLSGPGPLGERVRERKLEKVRHWGEIQKGRVTRGEDLAIVGVFISVCRLDSIFFFDLLGRGLKERSSSITNPSASLHLWLSVMAD